jgi:hypothetical protein
MLEQPAHLAGQVSSTVALNRPAQPSVLLAGFEPVPPQAVLAGQKDRVLDDTAGVPCLLREGLEFVQAPDEEQISDLLDDSSGLLMPPDQNESQMRSILLFSSPVITDGTLVTRSLA